MRSLSLLPLLLVACETMPSSGQPFAPAEVSAAPTGEVEEGGVDAEGSTDSRFALYDDLVTISSEELSGQAAPSEAGQPADGASDASADGAAGTGDDAETSSGDAVADAGDVQAGDAVSAASSTGMAAASGGGTLSASTGFGGFGATGWPLRLVATTPDAQPPRAILGLPNGQEMVVRPGAMVPELGVVVMSVGKGSVEVARIVPAGDHALVQSQTLTAQF